MALLWMDGFDSYGGTLSKMLDGEWAEVNSGLFSLSAANPRTGGHALRLLNNSNTGQVARRVFGGDKATVGVGFGMYMATLPGVDSMLQPIQWRDNANAVQCALTVKTTGDLSFYRGATLIDSTTSPPLTAAAYGHVEAVATIHDSAGAVEVRVNEVTVLNLTGIDTKATGVAGTAQMAIGQPIINYAPTTDFDDLFAWDTLVTDAIGGDIVDFVGDKKVLEDAPNEDGAEQDFSRSSGLSSYALVDDQPDDGDTSTIGSSAVSDQCALRFPDFSGDVIAVPAMMFVHRSKKTDAGTAGLKISARSGADVADGAATPITTAYTAYWMITQADAATGVPYTPTSAQETEALLERTS